MVTVPAIGNRRPWSSASAPTAPRLREIPSAYPIGTVTMVASRLSSYRSP